MFEYTVGLGIYSIVSFFKYYLIFREHVYFEKSSPIFPDYALIKCIFPPLYSATPNNSH